MAQVKLKCVLDDCDHETVQLDFDQARSMLDLHMRYAHPNGGANGGDRKLEKTRPSSWRHGNNIRRKPNSQCCLMELTNGKREEMKTF